MAIHCRIADGVTLRRRGGPSWRMEALDPPSAGAYPPRTMRAPLPSLIGVIHLRPLPESPRYGGDLASVVSSAERDARALAEAGFDGIMVENFGDAPFVPDRVSPVTVAAMTACAVAVRAAAPKVALGVNVLRNDAEAALAVAIAARAEMIRINVHTGARVTDQGLVEGRAHVTLRQRRALGAERVLLLCDVDVKHSAPLAARPLGRGGRGSRPARARRRRARHRHAAPGASPIDAISTPCSPPWTRPCWWRAA